MKRLPYPAALSAIGAAAVLVMLLGSNRPPEDGLPQTETPAPTVCAAAEVAIVIEAPATADPATGPKPKAAPEPAATPEPVALPDPSPEAHKGFYIKDIPLSENHQTVLRDSCGTYGVDISLALGVMECESCFVPDADNGTCRGLMQIHPINYEWLRERGIEPTTTEGNITAGVLMLGELLEKYDDTHKALMAYNCGETGAAELWEAGKTESGYSRAVVSSAERWQTIIDEFTGGI